MCFSSSSSSSLCKEALTDESVENAEKALFPFFLCDGFAPKFESTNEALTSKNEALIKLNLSTAYALKP